VLNENYPKYIIFFANLCSISVFPQKRYRKKVLEIMPKVRNLVEIFEEEEANDTFGILPPIIVNGGMTP